MLVDQGLLVDLVVVVDLLMALISVVQQQLIKVFQVVVAGRNKTVEVEVELVPLAQMLLLANLVLPETVEPEFQIT
jgi:hypothetical protein